jgi:plastocyanin
VRMTMILSITAALTLSACASEEPASTDDVAEAPADSGAGGSLTFVGTDDVAWAETSTSVAPGTVEVTIECGEGVNHTVAIEGVQGGEELAACDPGGTGSATVELEAGDATYFCTVPGHRDAGMEGTLTVG